MPHKQKAGGKKTQSPGAKQSHPAGKGGKRQQAGGPDHKGANAREDKNP